MDNDQILINFGIIIVTFIFAAFFVAAEFALVQVRVTALQDMQNKRDKPSKKIEQAINMVTNLTEYLSTTQVGTSVCGIILGWVGEETIEYLLADLLNLPQLPLSSSAVHAISAVVGVLVLTYFEVVLTEIVPKNIAIDLPMKMMMLVVTPLHYFHVIFYPFVWLLNTSANGIVRLLGLQPADENDEVLSQSEIISLSRNAVRGGEMDRNDLVYMERTFDFTDKEAHDVMVDRTRLSVIDVRASLQDALDMYVQTHYSRLPVVADHDKDKILGYVFNYDLIRQNRVNPNVPLTKIIRHLPTTPENTLITDVLQQMIRTRTPMVVVVDEYGGTSGIVTDKDIYEELFGTVRDEIDNVSDDIIQKNDDGTFNVAGKTTTYDFERYFGVDFEEFEKTEAVTLSGYLLDAHPKIHEGSQVKLHNFLITVTKYENSFILWMNVKEISEDQETAKQSDDDHLQQ
ncbi:MAG: hemolysin family protein [[Lactobacillus] timonensis]|uniref:hemolysin family protein n=1 Tax=[Lactobacillus] timonensis TaxID=1970790 RepID=UPI00235617FC|nr:hemolysin family protein [[Lactobacillus] timonensis]MCI1925436.1 hemolysin family protein [[Lactobacillus] timonensis]MCI1956812.1 hemolysin family protein [[Lactobacillus] timonensis]MCI1969802.1 hemolysin family protein [[Lactobacillus] timonensis]MCI2005985.1 hemolysin family protein [[Lactobacillus] timonensis]